MPSQKLNAAGKFLLGGGIVLLVVALGSHSHNTVILKKVVEPSPEPAQGVRSFAAVPESRRPDHSETSLTKLWEVQGSLAGLDRSAARQQLAELRKAFEMVPKDSAVASIRQFLNSKADSATHLGFRLARNGLLDEAPTFRTFLLDELGRLDPAAAADYAKEILSSMDSPDEWAIALRNLARGDTSTNARALLEQKTAQMLQYVPWQQNPSVGFLEAFDSAVYLGGTELIPTLSDLLKRQDNQAVAHAAYLALDRLVINDPSATLDALQTAPDSMQGRELTRANYFARADVRDPQQRQILQNYLLDPQLGPAELDKFASLFPNANLMISPNLLTPMTTPDHGGLASRDTESLRVVDEWLNDVRFAKLWPELEKTKARLAMFLAQRK